MKLMWFHLMPYTELPDDFREKHPSVWVNIHSSLFDPRRAHHMYNDFMDELEYAAECGFDAVCVNEHHSNGYGLMPSPNLIASSLARRTTDTAICVMGNSLALYNPPTRVAEEFAMIDCISGGRLIAGFPVGTPMDTCFAYGQNPSMLRERYLEAHDLVMRAGPSATLSRSTAASTSSATSTSGRGRFRGRTRRCGSRAAARSRPGSGARRWTTSTRISRISASRTAAPR
jgi:alkanesulfonate monooxygenase SsuD/methylene tetrahydromethanopterin reductase-like flavin-dependent oxidoreductase (luciferase family)